MAEARDIRLVGDSGFALEHVFAASRDEVYEAWTDPDLIGEWWGIEGSTSAVRKMDVREGGMWAIDMTVPGGTVYPNHGVFRSVVPGERLEYSQVFPDPGGGDHEIEVWHRVIFWALQPDSTMVTLEVTAPSQRHREQLLTSGMARGLEQGLDRLDRVLAHASAPNP